MELRRDDPGNAIARRARSPPVRRAVLFDARRRGLPDYLAGTEVVYDEPDG